MNACIWVAGLGTLNFFKGQGDGTVVEQTGNANPFKDIDVGTDSSPAIADWDGDSDSDLIVGDGDGKVHYFERQSDGSLLKKEGEQDNPFHQLPQSTRRKCSWNRKTF